jgi:hypothetical protein
MFHFPGLAAMHLCIQCMLIQESRAHHLFVGSPKLFADFHAFHRLSIPRHPPCALSNLTIGISNLNPTLQSRAPKGLSRKPNPRTNNSDCIELASIILFFAIINSPRFTSTQAAIAIRLYFNCARSNQFRTLRPLFRATKCHFTGFKLSLLRTQLTSFRQRICAQ